MASPSSRAGYPNRQLTTIPTHPLHFLLPSLSLSLLPDARAISPRFRAKPQLSSVFVIKRNHLGAKSRLPISLADEGLAKCHGNQSPVFVPRSLPFSPRDNSPRDTRGFSPRVAPCRSSWIRNTSTTLPTATTFLRSLEKHFEGEKEKWANEHADASVGSIFTFACRKIKREYLFPTKKMVISPDNYRACFIKILEYVIEIYSSMYRYIKNIKI